MFGTGSSVINEKGKHFLGIGSISVWLANKTRVVQKLNCY